MRVSVSRGGGEAGLVGHWTLSQSAETKGTEVLSNPSFENGTTSWGTQNFSVVADTSVSKKGSQSYRIYKTSWDWAAIYQTIPNASSYVGKTLVYSIWMRGDPSNPDNTDFQTGYPHIHTNLDSDGFRWTATNGSNSADGITKARFLSSEWYQYTGSYTVEPGVTSMELVVAPMWVGKTPTALNTDFAGFYIDDVSFKVLSTADSTGSANHGSMVNGPTYTSGPTGKGLGPDLVTNGTFDSSSWWSPTQAAITISGGTANWDGTNTNGQGLLRSNLLTVGKQYFIQWDIVSTNGVSVRPYLGVYPSGVFNTVGTHSVVMTSQSTHLYMMAATGLNGSVDNIVIREVSPDEALSFDGSNDSVSISDSDNLDFTGTDFTVSAWIKLNESANTSGVIAKNPSGNAGNSNYAFWKYPTSIMFYIGTGTGGQYNGVNSGTLSQDRWYLITALYDHSESKIKMYVDGVYVSQTSTTYQPTANSGPLVFGTLGTANFFNGDLADVRIYNRALSADEILNLSQTKESKMSTGSGNKGLVGHWPLTSESKKSATVVADATPNNNNGTISGATVRNQGYEFDGVDDWLIMPSNGAASEFHTGASGEFSYSMTIQSDDYAPTQSILSRRTGCNNNAHFNISTSANKLYFAFYSNLDSASGSYNSDAILTNGETYHITWVKKWGANDQTLYVNGTAVSLTGTSAAQGTTYDSLPILLGAQWSGDVCATGTITTESLRNLFNGTIADVRIYNRKLTAAEALALYNGANVPSPLVYWPLNSGPSDMSGNNRNLTVNGALLVGESAHFDGTNDFIDCGSNLLTDNETNLTVEAWIRTTYDAPFPGELGIVRQGAASTTGWSSPGWSLRLRDDIPAFAVRKKDNSGYWDLYTGNTVIDGQWHHIVGTFDTTTMRKYVDGVQTQTVSTGQSFLSANTACSIGKIGNYFNGEIKGVKVYNRTLSATEIASLYDQGFRQPKQFSTGNLNKGLVGYWPLKSEYETTSSNLVTNNAFETNISGWTNSGSAPTFERNINSPISGTGDFHWIGNPAGYSGAIASSGINFVSGRTYKLSFTYRKGGSNTVRLKIGDGASITSGHIGGSPATALPAITNTLYETTFTSTQTATGYLLFHDEPGTAGELYVDNIILKEVVTADTTPSANHGSLSGNPTVGADYTTFDGTNDYVDITNNAVLNPGTDDFSVGMWVKVPEKTSGGYGVVTKKYADAYGIYYVADSDKIGLYVQSGSSHNGVIISSYYDTWIHVFWTVDNDNDVQKSYLNGVFNNQTTHTVGNVTSTSNINIGRYVSIAGQYFNGDISDVRIYDRVLSDLEVKTLFDQGR